MYPIERMSSSTETTSVTYHFGGPVDAPEEYLDLWALLEQAPPGLTVNVMFNTSGGNLNTALQFISALENTQATVIGHAVGEVSSAGSLMFHACSEAVIYPHAYFLYHQASRFYDGKVSDTGKRVVFMVDHIGKLYREIYRFVLSDEEITRVLDGEELQLSGEEVRDRLVAQYTQTVEEMKEILNEVD